MGLGGPSCDGAREGGVYIQSGDLVRVVTHGHRQDHLDSLLPTHLLMNMFSRQILNSHIRIESEEKLLIHM